MMAKMRNVPRPSGGGSMINTSEVIALLFSYCRGPLFGRGGTVVERGVIIGTLKIFLDLVPDPARPR